MENRIDSFQTHDFIKSQENSPVHNRARQFFFIFNLIETGVRCDQNPSWSTHISFFKFGKKRLMPRVMFMLVNKGSTSSIDERKAMVDIFLCRA